MEIDQEQLVGALEFLEMIPELSGGPSSQYIRIAQKKSHIEFALASTIQGIVRVRGQLADGDQPTFYVDRKIFSPFVLVGKGSKKSFTSEMTADVWVLRQGNRRAAFVIRREELGGYCKWLNRETLKTVKVSEETRKLLEASRQCASVDPSLPALRCVYLDGQSVLASNMITVFCSTIKNGNNLNFPFPPEVIPLMAHESVEEIGIDGDRVIIMSRYGHLEGMVSAQAKKGFPRSGVHAQMEKAATWPVVVKLPSKVLSGMIGRMAIYLSGMESDKTRLRLEVNDGELRMIVRTAFGSFIESTRSDAYTSSTPMGWPLQAVKPVLEYIAANEQPIVVRTDENKKTPYLISGAGVELMVARKEK